MKLKEGDRVRIKHENPKANITGRIIKCHGDGFYDVAVVIKYPTVREPYRNTGRYFENELKKMQRQ